MPPRIKRDQLHYIIARHRHHSAIRRSRQGRYGSSRFTTRRDFRISQLPRQLIRARQSAGIDPSLDYCDLLRFKFLPFPRGHNLLFPLFLEPALDHPYQQTLFTMPRNNRRTAFAPFH